MPRRPLHFDEYPGLWPPSWPMGLTMLRLLLLPVFLWVMLSDAQNPHHPRRWLGVVIFAAMALTDKLDGYLARRLKQTSKLGALLDPVADKLLVGCCVILLSFEWLAPPGFVIPGWVVIAVYGKDVITAVGAITVLALAGKVRVSARPLGKVSTTLQMTMVMCILLAPPPGAARTSWWSPLVHGLYFAVAGIAAASLVDYVIQGFVQLFEARRARRLAQGELREPTNESHART